MVQHRKKFMMNSQFTKPKYTFVLQYENLF